MPRFGSAGGFTLLEVIFVAALAATTAAWAIPQTRSVLDDVRTGGAVRYLVARLHHARMEAIGRSRDAAVRFVPAGASYRYAAYVDGNHNGVRRADIQDGVDRAVQAPERLPDQFPGVDFGALPGLPPVEGSVPPGSDPVRCGSGGMITFTPLGTATSASLYIRGRRAQYVIRVFGQTGRIRILKFDSISRRWRSL
jgi:hypothetical protein